MIIRMLAAAIVFASTAWAQAAKDAEAAED